MKAATPPTVYSTKPNSSIGLRPCASDSGPTTYTLIAS
jgi:hypothetical protein